jgi:hypothetical protein
MRKPLKQLVSDLKSGIRAYDDESLLSDVMEMFGGWVPKDLLKQKYSDLKWTFKSELSDLEKENCNMPVRILIFAALGILAYLAVRRNWSQSRGDERADEHLQPPFPSRTPVVEHMLCLIVGEGDLASRFEKGNGTVSENDWGELADSFTQRWFGERAFYDRNVQPLLKSVEDSAPSQYSVRCISIPFPEPDRRFDSYNSTRAAIRNFKRPYKITPPLSKAELVGKMFD